jgi:secretion/DNA translocation related TadE-like protein
MVVGCLSLLMVIGAALGVMAAMVRSHRLAQSAADLAALAGAAALQHGRDPCQAARSIASANEAALVECRVTGRDVVVRTEVSGPRWLGQQGDLVAEARAGPAGAPGAG